MIALNKAVEFMTAFNLPLGGAGETLRCRCGVDHFCHLCASSLPNTKPGETKFPVRVFFGISSTIIKRAFYSIGSFMIHLYFENVKKR